MKFAFHQILRTMAQVYMSDISLTFTVEKKEIDHFGTNLRRLRRLTKQLTQSTSKYQKDILTDGENYYDTQHIKRIFWYLAVLISNS